MKGDTGFAALYGCWSGDRLGTNGAVMMTIRDAVATDDERVLSITNREIREDANNWTLEEMSLADIEAWRMDAEFPLLVAEIDGRVLGFGKYGPFRPKTGYKHTIEHTIYVSPEAHRQGVGRALMTALIEHAQAAGRYHVMVGGIEAGNTPSLALHAAFGFEEVGRMPQVGRKFDRWLDLVLVQRVISNELEGGDGDVRI